MRLRWLNKTHGNGSMSESERELLRRAFWIMCKTPAIFNNQKHADFLDEVEECLKKMDEPEVTGIPV